ncbi:hypothetical protein SAMN05216582_11411 [Selenomonas ruminantium]|uniref:Uncharacterized protein n=1 Tax=Selenomonas ruminantium TaxID=971 RepID=A0A1M6UQD6_SELRU|nr:hypothetical protein [Selenomonas ruminantium]SHK71427.1 hypothetical protein SAMN05216582_11411 [Selenomonas ruminantium]
MDMSIGATSGYNSPYNRNTSYGNYGNYNDSQSPYNTNAPTDETETDDIDGKKSSPGECQTCKNRKYQDGSDEMVSFKAAGHIDPNNAASVVMSHEQEHVSNAYQKADAGNGEVVRANVRLKTDVCPECGRTYISGGETTTQIRYVNETNPYQKDLKESDKSKYQGANVDIDAG